MHKPSPMPKISEALADSARNWPDHPAIIDAFGALDYRTLHEEIENFQHQLRMMGIGPGCGIGVMARNGSSFVTAALAAVGCGATVMPISHQIIEAEVQEILRSAPLHGILYDDSGMRLLGGVGERLRILNGQDMILFRTDTGHEQPFANLVPDPAFVRFTSGTTGRSRGVILSHRDVLERTAAANRGLQLGPDDAVVWVMPMAFHFFVSIILYLRYGTTIAVCRNHFAETILEIANRHHGTLLYASPFHYRLLAAETAGHRFTTLRKAISTSVGLPLKTAETFQRCYGLPIMQAYGVIEVGLPIINLDHAADHPEAIGRALPDFEVALLDEQFRPVGEGRQGQLAIRGPGMFSAYLSPPCRRDEVLKDGWFLTGDMAVQNEEGLLTVCGRCKSIINVGGNKVFPEEVEAILDLHPQVEVSRVHAREHPQMGEVVHADVVLCDPDHEIGPEELIAFCHKHLSGYRVPASIAFVHKIEKTASGKICRR